MHISFETTLRAKYGKKYCAIFPQSFRESVKTTDKMRRILSSVKEDLSEKIILLRNGKW